ncbi:wax ester/triacylglycerol synthase family O-acyltransferase [Leifsonia soli]
MAAVDAANFTVEQGQPNVVTLVGLLAPGGFVDGTGDPDVDALREVLAPRVERLAALHRVPVESGGEWRWRSVDPDLAQHIRVIRPEPPTADGDASTALERTCARVVMTPLDTRRPLWEVLLVPRVAGDRCGMLFRLHHAVADGLGAEAVVAALSDPLPAETPVAAGPGPADPAAPGRRPFVLRLGDLVDQTLAVFRRRVHSKVLLGPLGATRDVAFLEVDLASLHEGARRLGGTINDAFLAAFGRGIRAMLVAAGEVPPATLPVSSPVRLARSAGAGNATGVMLVEIPVGSAQGDPRSDGSVARVAAVTRSEKARARAVGTFRLMRSPRAARFLMRFARRQRAVAAIASELTGPAHALRLAGADLAAAWPLALLSGNVRVGALAVSYAGRFRVSVQTDGEHVPPARVLADAMADALDRIAAQGERQAERTG